MGNDSDGIRSKYQGLVNKKVLWKLFEISTIDDYGM